MRFYYRLLACVVTSLSLSLAAATGVAAEASQQPSLAELEQALLDTKAEMGRLQAQVAELQRQLHELQASAVRPPEEAEEAVREEDMEALRRAAQMEAAGAAEAAAPAPEEAVFTSGALGLQALNPEISVTGDMISSYRSGGAASGHTDFNFRTLGIHSESYLDPYSRFKAAVPVSQDGAELGEAYFTRFGWRDDLNLTLGKFRQQLGVVNRWHKHGLDQVDFPLPLRQLLGPGGLNQTGVSLDWQMPPLGNAAQELTLQVTDGQNPRLFGGNSRSMPSALVHYRNYRDLSKDTYLEYGLTALAGRNDTWPVLGPGDEVVQQGRNLWTTMLGADLTLLCEPTEQMRYRNWVWRTEAYLLNRDLLAPDGSGRDSLRSWGAYTYYQQRLSRTHEAGLRVDYYWPDVKSYADLPGLSLAPLAVAEPGAHQWLIAPYLTWYQSPWVHWRVEWDHLCNHDMGPDEDTLMLQCVFAAGPHKHERY